MFRRFLQWLVFGKLEAATAELKSFEGAVVHDVDELAKRVSVEVLAGIRKEISKAKQVASRPKVSVKKK